MQKTAASALAVMAALVFAAPASAHITFGSPNGTVGGSYRAVLRVPHGCGGAATTAIRIQIPEGVITVKPMPKPGWQIELVSGPYARTYTRFGAEVKEGVTEIRWSGGELPDAFYDEFIFTGTISDAVPAGQELYFPVVQECGAASDRWIQIPAAGGAEPEFPAPGIMIDAAGPPAH